MNEVKVSEEKTEDCFAVFKDFIINWDNVSGGIEISAHCFDYPRGSYERFKRLVNVVASKKKQTVSEFAEAMNLTLEEAVCYLYFLLKDEFYSCVREKEEISL